MPVTSLPPSPSARDDAISPPWWGTVRTGTPDCEMLKYKGERISDGWCYPSDRAVPPNRAKKITE